MIRSVIFLLIFLFLDASISFGQDVFITKDSSRMIFPNQVAIDFERKGTTATLRYEFNQPAMKTLLLQWNYVYGMLDASRERSTLLEKELITKDSTIQALTLQSELTSERHLIYSSSYSEMKSVANRYDAQVKALIAELETIRKIDRKAKRKVFSKGVLAGMLGGFAITSFLVLRRD
jgi:hypothetical protein